MNIGYLMLPSFISCLYSGGVNGENVEHVTEKQLKMIEQNLESSCEELSSELEDAE